MRHQVTGEPSEKDAARCSHQAPETYDLCYPLRGEQVRWESIEIAAPKLHGIRTQTNHGNHPANVVQIDGEHAECYQDSSHKLCLEPSDHRLSPTPYQSTGKCTTGNVAKERSRIRNPGQLTDDVNAQTLRIGHILREPVNATIPTNL